MLAAVVVIWLLGLGLGRHLVRLQNRLVFWTKLDAYDA
jgi:hypothetical protein